MMKQILLLAALMFPVIASAQTAGDVALMERVQKDSILIEKLKSDKKKLEQNINELNQRIDTLQLRVDVINRVPDFIYQQCLRFPLTQKYYKELIDESKKCVDNLTYWNNTRYSEATKLRREMLDKYKGYNDELLQFLTDTRKALADKNWNVTTMLRTLTLDKLKKLTYYPLYTEKIKTIDYLNGIISRFMNMLDQESVSQKAYDELIKDLEPMK